MTPFTFVSFFFGSALISAYDVYKSGFSYCFVSHFLHISLIFWCFCCNSYWYNKLDCWRLPPFIIVLFCLFIVITEIFSIPLNVCVAIENRSISSMGSGEPGDIIKQECNKAANCRSKKFYQGILYSVWTFYFIIVT